MQVHYPSQCTYRCVVLPDSTLSRQFSTTLPSLNAPTGAWCSLTISSDGAVELPQQSQCTYRCVVLPDLAIRARDADLAEGLNTPTGAWCSLT